jgi:hypothetical protein
MIQVIDDFLPTSYAEQLKANFTGQFFPWFFEPASTKNHLNSADYYSAPLMYNHIIRDGQPQNQYADFLIPIQYYIEERLGFKLSIRRVKVNLTFNVFRDTSMVEEPHIDEQNNPADYVCIYYPISSDGDTVVYKEDSSTFGSWTEESRITPKQNTMVIIPGNRWHSSSTPIDNISRLSLNMAFDKV